MAWFTATNVKQFAAELLLTSDILDDTINNLYIPRMIQDVLDLLDPVYITPLKNLQGVLIADNAIPQQILNAAFYKTIEITIVNNYADKANNQEALGVAKYYGDKAKEILGNITPDKSGTIKLIFPNLLQRQVNETEFSFIGFEDPGGSMERRAGCFIDLLSDPNRFI